MRSVGPGGTGKTHIVYLIVELRGLPTWEINCGLQTSFYDLFGRYIGLGKENWVDGQIVMWCRHGGLLYLNEANMMKQDIAAKLNLVLNTRGHVVLNAKEVPTFILTDNTPLLLLTRRGNGRKKTAAL